MAKQKTVVPFHGTPEQEKQLREVIDAHRNIQGALMPVLQKAQDIYGYLPIEVQTIIAEELGLSLEQVYQVVTFYSQFALNPTGKYRIAVCLGTACYVKGSQNILDELEKQLGIKAGGSTSDGLFTLEATRCLGCCGLAPVMMVNDEVYGRLTVKDVKDILAKYR
ncbi:MAG: NADH-quinone oxidoreductase subunit NuoE [Clostridia bacterium]|nr:NADH-quinone oxidoreductase subunit NuoE [Clostridia bacterium]MCR5073901.1 NADH-quinone oxidoreductase subunit NuoE [Clostridiales bacterium]